MANEINEHAMQKDPTDHYESGISRKALAALKPGEPMPGNLKKINKAMIDKLIPGKSTLADVSAVFPVEKGRQTFKDYFFRMLYEGREYEIYRITDYYAGSLQIDKFNGGVSYGWKERIKVTALFDKNDILQFYYVAHGVADFEGAKRNPKRGPLTNFDNGKGAAPWLNAPLDCASDLYRYMYGGMTLKEWHLGNGCLWEEDYHAGKIPTLGPKGKEK